MDPKSRKFSAIEAVSCCLLVKTRMLNEHVPVRVVSIEVVVRNCKLDPPLIHIIVLEMPMDSNWTHVVGTFNYIFLIIWPSQRITWPGYLIISSKHTTVDILMTLMKKHECSSKWNNMHLMQDSEFLFASLHPPQVQLRHGVMIGL